MYTKIIIFILACTYCALTKITYHFNNDKYVFCGDMSEEIITNIATYKEEVNGDYKLQGWYTKQGHLYIGARCE